MGAGFVAGSGVTTICLQTTISPAMHDIRTVRLTGVNFTIEFVLIAATLLRSFPFSCGLKQRPTLLDKARCARTASRRRLDGIDGVCGRMECAAVAEASFESLWGVGMGQL